ncbi:hypothetical protein CHARACLAT_010606 [Characodon lateralis]|uniref:Uncharacterized protein n=1 Tax=Characodon lateralis TaxID=208331 RepID=A0ABU7DS74_9TELE|nr:hypothetical protein [Characodon lateralis]
MHSMKGTEGFGAIESWGQQVHEASPDLLLPSYILQLILRDPKRSQARQDKRCLAEKKSPPKKRSHTLIFRWTAFSFDYGMHSLWHCFYKLLQYHKTYFHPVLH